ncbi:MAG: thiopurine S-methyltransferase [Candidatus Sericytochromatia bacterium]
MDSNFWLERWNKNEIGFHRNEANPILVKFFNQLSLKDKDRIFIPLCGKTLDISWLISNGFKVVGVELSEIAIQQLFSDINIKPNISEIKNFKHYSSENIDIYVGDFFNMTKEILGNVDAIYDRACIIALPEEMRNNYAKHLVNISNNTNQLLITFDYNQNERQGPPFSVSEEEVNRHYKDSYNINLLESSDISESMKSNTTIKENVWLLTKR